MPTTSAASIDGGRWLTGLTALLLTIAVFEAAWPPRREVHVIACDVALRIDGVLRCDAEGVTLAWICGGGSALPLRSGDAVDRALACAARPPLRGAAGLGRMAPDDLAILELPIAVNEASLEELDTLPGIGPVLARRMIEGRPYQEIGDLRRVPGIGPKKLAQIRARARVRW